MRVHERPPAHLAREMKASEREKKDTREGFTAAEDTETRNYVAVAARR